MTTRSQTLARDLPRLLLAAAAAFMSGCAPNDGPRVWGRVMVDGRPVTRGTVVLKPQSPRGQHDTWGGGHLDKAGRFEVVCSRPDVPLAPGRYWVYIKPMLRYDPKMEELVMPKDYRVPKKFLDPEVPVIQIDVGEGPTRLELNLDE